MKKKILIFSGAGVSAESGIKTFRDSDGLWENHSVEEVASVDVWQRNPEKVLNFYNDRKKEYSSVGPNDAHKIIAEMEQNFEVVVVTQNVDDLHEKAGSSNVIHLHGEITKLRSEGSNYKSEWSKDIKMGDKCPDGYQLRPDIVWFGENLDMSILDKVNKEASSADICIIVGTSMQVQPAASIPWLTKETTLTYYVDPSDADFYVPKLRSYFFYHFKDPATIGIQKVYDDISKIFKNK